MMISKVIFLALVGIVVLAWALDSGNESWTVRRIRDYEIHVGHFEIDSPSNNGTSPLNVDSVS